MKVLAALQGLTPSPAHCPGIVVAVGGEGEAAGPEPGDLHLGGRVGGLQPVVTLLGVAKPQPEPAVPAPVALQRVQGGVERGRGRGRVADERLLLAGEEAARRVVPQHLREVHGAAAGLGPVADGLRWSQ